MVKPFFNPFKNWREKKMSTIKYDIKVEVLFKCSQIDHDNDVTHLNNNNYISILKTRAILID